MNETEFVRGQAEILFEGHLIDVVVRNIRVPDGSSVTRETVVHPGAVGVVALDTDGTVVLERQYRAALDRRLLEIPAGKRDVPGEPPLETARRELIEETGFAAAEWFELGSFFNSPGFTDEHTVLFLATGLSEVGSDVQGPEEEAMELVRMPLVEVWDRVESGELVDAKSIIALTMTLRHLEI